MVMVIHFNLVIVTDQVFIDVEIVVTCVVVLETASTKHRLLV